jgi:hypothetical protein
MPVGAAQAVVVPSGQASKLMAPMPVSNVNFNVAIGNLTSMPASAELRIYVQSTCESAPLVLSTQ